MAFALSDRRSAAKCCLASICLLLHFIAGCGPLERRVAVPRALTTTALIPGLPDNIRYFPRDPGDVADFSRDWLDSNRVEAEYLARSGHRGPLPAANYLAISGGGDDGAFGAGLLNGWSRTGSRPRFKMVTGVSTGALMAPFAFLGADYDDQLKRFYTEITPADIAERRSLIFAVLEDGWADNAPLRKLVKRYVTPEMLKDIAAEYAKGRILLVGTTNLDARREVIWNLTKIAAAGNSEALELFRTILIASSAVPGTFPPVMIDVEAGGKQYQEMHVDGGAAAQVFIYPAAVKIGRLSMRHDMHRERRLYIIRNARLDPQWAEVERRTLPIAFRAISTLIQYQGIGDLYRLYSVTQRDGIDFNLAFIPQRFDVPHEVEFDQHYMGKLFEWGYELAIGGLEWSKAPPILHKNDRLEFAFK